MGSGFLMGLVLGGLLGSLTGSFTGAIVVMIVGAVLGAAYGAWRADRVAKSAQASQGEAWIRARLDALERRVAELEGQHAPAVLPSAPSSPSLETDPNVPPPAPSYRAASEPAPSYRAAPESAPSDRAASEPAPGERAESRKSPLAHALAWLGGGNALTRIGIVILFFGVAFLLSHFAELVTIPIGVKVGAVFLAGIAVTVAGVRLARDRPGYGLSLQGAGMGIAALTVFAAFHLYEIIAPGPAVALLAAIVAATIALALRGDSQALAALAVAGGFLAPFLIPADVDSPAMLFGYFAILNLVGFALAWRRTWRVLDVVGFGFTLALGIAWGYRFYAPQHYAVVQSFLVLFFLFFVITTLLHARAGRTAPVAIDGIMVFGVPLAAFAIQMPLVEHWRYGVATSAFALALFYALLWWMVRRREPSLQRLAVPFAGLAIAFATLAIPFAFDARSTAAWWAVEAAAVYALGVAQRSQPARAFALALQVGAALAFAWDTPQPTGTPFLNAAFLGMALIALASWATAWVGDRASARGEATPPPVLGPRERSLLPWLVAWGLLWWLAAGISEAHVRLPRPDRLPASLLWIASAGLIGMAAAQLLRWQRIGWIAAAVFPAMLAILAVAVRDDFATLRSSLAWVAWMLAWGTHGVALYVVDRIGWVDAGGERGRVRAEIASAAHAGTALLAVAWLGWELYAQADRVSVRGSVWKYCALAWPAIAALLLVRTHALRAWWPMTTHADAYVRKAGGVLAILLCLFVVVAATLLDGRATPLRYLPLLNPLELTLLAALVALWRYAPLSSLSSRNRVDAFAGLMFVVLSSMVARTVHHVTGVRWNLHALWNDRVLQASLTLTWTTMALFVMLRATRVGSRTWWMAGAVLLGAVVAKLFLVDLAALSGWSRVVAFLGTGVILLAIGYLAPLPPSTPEGKAASGTGDDPRDTGQRL